MIQKRQVRSKWRSLQDVATQAAQLNRLFSIDHDVGLQLDTVGEWIGLSRYVKKTITGVYFAFDNDEVGFDRGSWKRRYDADSGFTELDDETYRQFYAPKIAPITGAAFVRCWRKYIRVLSLTAQQKYFLLIIKICRWTSI